ncbi:phosphatase, putative [Eimeria tenella]|uniref:Protein tyrosine phosphatase type IVA 3 n=1 Tax=Eimeria tenella TaxID=5802 RepID=U6KMJ3_EIMTE|nr:phosphatase, putative [Eimeria tenella]CDJ39206.1 phosphatase, putative [Eimeria tenella]|eukprot:XP_013229961.1 phosphatase, putative [Eimeria tenella]
MVFFSRMRREKRKCDGSSSFCCSKSETDSECSSLRQDVCDTLQPQQQLLAPSPALDQWSFPSCRSGLRTNNSNNSNGGHRLFSRLANHGAAFPAEVPRMMGRHNNGTLSQSRQENLCAAREAGTAAAVAHAQRCVQRSPTAGVPCCCCSDSSTQSGGSSELCRGRWCNAACSSGLLLQQQQDQLKPPQVPQQQQHAAGMVLNVPTLIESRGVKCLILDAPTNENLQAYLAQLVQVGVTDLVRTCPPTYDEAPVVGAGIRMHDLTFPDGEAPPDEVIARWRALAAQAKAEGGVLAVHCVAGLGRGPVLVAVSLIDSGLEAEEAVNFIRSRRKGAINRRQLAFLHSYRRHAVASRRCIKGCSIM